MITPAPGGIVDADTGFPYGGVGDGGFASEVGFEEGGLGGPGLATVGHGSGIDDGEDGVCGICEGGEANVAPCVFVGDVGET